MNETQTYIATGKYENQSVAALRKLAAGRVPNYRKMRKDALVGALAEIDVKEANAATEKPATAKKTKTQTKTQPKAAKATSDHESDAKTDKDGKPFKSTKAPKIGRKMCQICSKRPVDRKTQGRDSTMCEPCFDYAGWENTHSDHDHEAYRNGSDDPFFLATEIQDELNECPVCQGKDPANDIVKTKANGSKPGRVVSKPMAVESKSFDAKAKAFATIAKAAGWSSKVNAVSKTTAQVIATTREGETLTMVWTDGAYQYDLSEYKNASGRKAKIRNASAARKIVEA